MDPEKLHLEAMKLANDDITAHFNKVLQKLSQAALKAYWPSLKQLFQYWKNNTRRFNELFTEEERGQFISILNATANTKHVEALILLSEIYQKSEIVLLQKIDYKIVHDYLSRAAEYNLEQLTALKRPQKSEALDAQLHSELALKLHEEILKILLSLCYQINHLREGTRVISLYIATVISAHKNTMQAGQYELACASLNKLYDWLFSLYQSTPHQKNSQDSLDGSIHSLDFEPTLCHTSPTNHSENHQRAFKLTETLLAIYEIYIIGSQNKHVPSMLALAFCLKTKSNNTTNRFDLPVNEAEKQCYQKWISEAFTQWGVPRCEEYEHRRNALIEPSLHFHRTQSRLEFIDEITQSQLFNVIKRGDYETFVHYIDVFKVPLTITMIIKSNMKETQTSLSVCIRKNAHPCMQVQFLQFIATRGYEPYFSKIGVPELSEYYWLNNTFKNCPSDILGIIFQYLSIDLNCGTNNLYKEGIEKAATPSPLLISATALNTQNGTRFQTATLVKSEPNKSNQINRALVSKQPCFQRRFMAMPVIELLDTIFPD